MSAFTQAGVSREDADIYAEGLRRGGAVSARACRTRTHHGCRRSWIGLQCTCGRRRGHRPAGSRSMQTKAHTRLIKFAKSASYT